MWWVWWGCHITQCCMYPFGQISFKKSHINELYLVFCHIKMCFDVKKIMNTLC